MRVQIRQIIAKLTLPTIGIGLAGYGIGGKQLPTANAMLEHINQWLANNTDYPWLFAAGITLLLLWMGYQILHFIFTTRKEKWRSHLLDLLNEGVAIRNKALTLQSKNDAPQWTADATEWEKRVYNKIKSFDRNGAEDFRLLDVSPEPRLPLRTDVTDHAWYYHHHDYRLVKLRAVIQENRQS